MRFPRANDIKLTEYGQCGQPAGASQRPDDALSPINPKTAVEPPMNADERRKNQSGVLLYAHHAQGE
jgi:hypothetical protein